MKRCPVCNSRKIDGNRRIGFHCRNCNYRNIPENIRKSLQEAKNDRGIIKQRIESSTIINSSLFSGVHDLHNIAFKFKIYRFPASINLPKQMGFRGEVYRFNYKGRKVMLSKNWLVIYNSGRVKIPLKDLKEKEAEIREELISIADEISKKYHIEISHEPLLFSSNRPEIKTPFLSSTNFIEPEVKAVYPVPSPIEVMGGNASKNAVNLTDALSQLLEAIGMEIHNKQLHQSVLEDMSLTLQEIRDNVSMPHGITYKLKNLFGFWLSKLKLKTIPNSKEAKE